MGRVKLYTVYPFIIYTLTRAQVFNFSISFRNIVIILLFCITCCLFHPFIVDWHILTHYHHHHHHHHYYYYYYYYYLNTFYSTCTPLDFVVKTWSIPASYSYCCNGLYCPDYPIKLSVELINKTFQVQGALNLSCHKRIFEKTLSVDVVPGNYIIKVWQQIRSWFAAFFPPVLFPWVMLMASWNNKRDDYDNINIRGSHVSLNTTILFPQILHLFVIESSPEYRSRTVGNIFVKGETIIHECTGWDNYGVGGIY